MGMYSRFQVSVIPVYGRFMAQGFDVDTRGIARKFLEALKDHYDDHEYGNWEISNPSGYFSVIFNREEGKYYDFLSFMHDVSNREEFIDVDFRITQVYEWQDLKTYRVINGKTVQHTTMEIFPSVEIGGENREIDPSWFSVDHA